MQTIKLTHEGEEYEVDVSSLRKVKPEVFRSSTLRASVVNATRLRVGIAEHGSTAGIFAGEFGGDGNAEGIHRSEALRLVHYIIDNMGFNPHDVFPSGV